MWHCSVWSHYCTAFFSGLTGQLSFPKKTFAHIFFLHEKSLLVNCIPRNISEFDLIIQMRPVDEREDFALEVETIVSSSLPSTKIVSSESLHSSSLLNVAYSRILWEILKGLSKSIKVVVFSAKINILLPFGPLSIILHFLTKNHVSQSWNMVCTWHFCLLYDFLFLPYTILDKLMLNWQVS